MAADGFPEDGWVGEDVAADFPQLGLLHLTVELTAPVTSKGLKDRLPDLERYFGGGVVTQLRTRPVTAAHRVFFRQIGLDPDVDRTPVEAIVLARLTQGRFTSRGFLADALTITAMETEVPVGAIDGRSVLGPLGVSVAREGEELDGDPPVLLTASSLVVADITRPLALAFGAAASPFAPAEDAEQAVLYALVVPGVARATVVEALWVAAGLLGGDP